MWCSLTKVLIIKNQLSKDFLLILNKIFFLLEIFTILVIDNVMTCSKTNGLPCLYCLGKSDNEQVFLCLLLNILWVVTWDLLKHVYRYVSSEHKQKKKKTERVKFRILNSWVYYLNSNCRKNSSIEKAREWKVNLLFSFSVFLAR